MLTRESREMLEMHRGVVAECGRLVGVQYYENQAPDISTEEE